LERSSGRLIEIGITMLAKERMAKVKLKIMGAFAPNHLLNSEYPNAASKQPSRFKPARLPKFTSFEKLISVAKK
jgi:hypothetical protein